MSSSSPAFGRDRAFFVDVASGTQISSSGLAGPRRRPQSAPFPELVQSESGRGSQQFQLSPQLIGNLLCHQPFRLRYAGGRRDPHPRSRRPAGRRRRTAARQRPAARRAPRRRPASVPRCDRSACTGCGRGRHRLGRSRRSRPAAGLRRPPHRDGRARPRRASCTSAAIAPPGAIASAKVRWNSESCRYISWTSSRPSRARLSSTERLTRSPEKSPVTGSASALVAGDKPLGGQVRRHVCQDAADVPLVRRLSRRS